MSKLLPKRGCLFCFRIFTPKRAWQQFCGTACRRSATKESLKTEYMCEYCGLVGDTVDHIPPISIRPALVDLGLAATFPFIIVRACKECNCALGDRALWTVPERRAFIYKWLEHRYRRFLDIPHWTTEELETLDYTLKKRTMQGIAIRDLTLLRLERAGRDIDGIVFKQGYREEREPTSKDEPPPTTFCSICGIPTQDDQFCSLKCYNNATPEQKRVDRLKKYLKQRKR